MPFALSLVNASKANPILLHLEHLHWADQPSLQLLQHLARRFKGSHLMVVGTYRDVELDRSHPLSAVLAELRRARLYERVLLRGLSGISILPFGWLTRTMRSLKPQHRLVEKSANGAEEKPRGILGVGGFDHGRQESSG